MANYAEGSKTVTGVGSASETEILLMAEGEKTVTGVGIVQIVLGKGWPINRFEDYDATLIWDEENSVWIAADGSGGSRYQSQLVIVGQDDFGDGVIYYGSL